MRERRSETVWTDPATMADDQIETELAELATKLSEPGWEIQARHWRLGAELRFRKGKAMTTDEISQSERRKILAEDRQRLNTYRAHAEANADLELGGRFSKVTTTTVIGASPIRYPRLPQGSPWACDPCPTEPPLNYDINAMEPVGGPHEREGTPPSPTAVELDLVAPPDGDVRRAATRKAGWRRL
jgi:hypothetical protein